MQPGTLNLSDAAFILQTVTPEITPETFGPVTRWWDADSLNYLTTGAIVATDQPWDDKSVNDDDAFSTTGAEPTLQKEVINGHSTLRFVGDATGRHMLFEGGDLFLSDFTILCVALTASDSNYLGRDGFNRQIRINWNGQPRASWFGGNSGQELISNQFLSNANLPRMIGHRRFGNAPGSPIRTFRFFDNATEVLPTTTNVDDIIMVLNEIGTLAGFATPISIDIAELVIYDRALTNEEIQTLYYEYFKPKFALP